MWRCLDCETRFEEPSVYMEKHGWDHPPFEKWPCCPTCDSLDLEELFFCLLCGEEKPWHEMSEGDSSVCCDCYGLTLAKWQKIKEGVAETLLSQAEIRLLKENEVF